MTELILQKTRSLFQILSFSREKKRNRYRFLMLRLVLNLIKRRKLTLRKLFNTLHCYTAYFFKWEKSAATPLMMNFELWNECNEACVFCRTAKGEIYDQNPDNPEGYVVKGQMKFELYKAIIDEVKDSLLMAVPYINGEPLIYKHINEAIRYSSERRVATTIASNGILLDERRGKELLEAGLDFIKVHISGMTNEVHQIQHRRGDVEKIKRNIRNFVRMNEEGKYGTLVLLDYIIYEHNKHQIDEARRFADELGIMFSMRPGNPKGMEESEQPQHQGPLPVDIACDWLWKVMSIDWDGAMLPCCDFVVWSANRPYGSYEIGKTWLKEVWNGDRVRKMRRMHTQNGRRDIDICSQCPRTGIAFKY